MQLAPTSQPRVFHGWWVVLVSVLAMFAATLTGGSGFSVFVLPISAELGWDRKTIAGALSVGTILGALAAPYAGRLVDRYGARVMLTATGLGLAITLVPLAWVQTPLMFYLGYSSARLIDMGVLNTAATTAVANWFVRRRGRALGLTMAGNAIGIALLVPLAQQIISGWGWRTAWFVLALGVTALLTPLAWWLVRRRPEDLGLRPDGDLALPTGPASAAAGRAATPLQADWALGAAVRSPAFWLLTLSGSLSMFAIAGMSIHLVPLLIDNGLDTAVVAWLVSLYGLCMTSGCLTWGLVTERIPSRYALALAYLLAGGSMLALNRVNAVGPAMFFIAVYGLVNGGKETLDAVVWADYFGRRSLGAIRGSSRPLIVGAYSGGGFVAGWAYDSFGSYAGVITVFGLLAIGGGLLVALARPPLVARPAAGPLAARP